MIFTCDFYVSVGRTGDTRPRLKLNQGQPDAGSVGIFLGLVESFIWGRYVTLAFGSLYNFFALRWR